MPRGYDRTLYVLSFDPRGSFQTKLFGWQPPLNPAPTAQVAPAKRVIYEGFRWALAAGAPRAKGGGRGRDASAPPPRGDAPAEGRAVEAPLRCSRRAGP